MFLLSYLFVETNKEFGESKVNKHFMTSHSPSFLCAVAIPSQAQHVLNAQNNKLSECIDFIIYITSIGCTVKVETRLQLEGSNS